MRLVPGKKEGEAEEEQAVDLAVVAVTDHSYNKKFFAYQITPADGVKRRR